MHWTPRKSSVNSLNFLNFIPENLNAVLGADIQIGSAVLADQDQPWPMVAKSYHL